MAGGWGKICLKRLHEEHLSKFDHRKPPHAERKGVLDLGWRYDRARRTVDDGRSSGHILPCHDRNQKDMSMAKRWLYIELERSIHVFEGLAFLRYLR